MSRILIVDDEPAIGWSLREILTDAGHSAEIAGSVEEGLEAARRLPPDAMLLDVRLPGRDGLSAVPDFRRLAPSAVIVVMTAFGDLDTAVRAVEAGAADYLVKPFDLDRVTAVMATAIAVNASDRSASPVQAEGPLLVGSSPAMQEVFKRVALVARTGLPVLITGQTGTGKELVARAIHSHGTRARGPFIATNLASLSGSVIESDLFGHVRGAFTGATVDRKGYFELASGGTILLAARRAMESLTLDRGEAHLKDELMPRYAELVYDGLWFSPLKRALDAFVDSSQEFVTGDVRLTLEPGRCYPSGRRAERGLYDYALATYEAADAFRHEDAAGFVRLWGLSVETVARRQGGLGV